LCLIVKPLIHALSGMRLHTIFDLHTLESHLAAPLRVSCCK
jgi:hypothetical protein